MRQVNDELFFMGFWEDWEFEKDDGTNKKGENVALSNSN